MICGIKIKTKRTLFGLLLYIGMNQAKMAQSWSFVAVCKDHTQRQDFENVQHSNKAAHTCRWWRCPSYVLLHLFGSRGSNAQSSDWILRTTASRSPPVYGGGWSRKGCVSCDSIVHKPLQIFSDYNTQRGNRYILGWRRREENHHRESESRRWRGGFNEPPGCYLSKGKWKNTLYITRILH